MKVKTDELSGAALDWAVAKCEGQRVYIAHNHTMTGVCILDAELVDMDVDGPRDFCPSRDWAQGGPIIEREKISIRQWTNVPVVHAYMPQDGAQWSADAQSPLIAAMRCFCRSKLGDEVDIPEELL